MTEATLIIFGLVFICFVIGIIFDWSICKIMLLLDRGVRKWKSVLKIFYLTTGIMAL